MDNETWLLVTADVIIRAQIRDGPLSRTSWEKLVYCLWVADYGMRNAGDVATAYDLFPNFHSDGRRLAAELSLPGTSELFSLSTEVFERRYFDLFDGVCGEMKDHQARFKD